MGRMRIGPSSISKKASRQAEMDHFTPPAPTVIEVPVYIEKIVEVEKLVEVKVIEKQEVIVDRPVEVIIEKEVKVTEFIEKIVEKPIEVIVEREKIVERETRVPYIQFKTPQWARWAVVGLVIELFVIIGLIAAL